MWEKQSIMNLLPRNQPPSATFNPWCFPGNSWGPEWGEDGHMRLLRVDDSDRDAAEAPGHCGIDYHPQEGVACEGETAPVPVCGMCTWANEGSEIDAGWWCLFRKSTQCFDMFFDAILSNPYFVEGSLQSGNMTDIQEHCLGTSVSVPA